MIKNETHTNHSFTGLDLFTKPGKLSPGFLTVADNVFIKGGELYTRPGRAGQWRIPLNNPLYELLPFTAADGSTKLLFTSGGKLYKTGRNDTAPTEITQPGGASVPTINSPNARMVRLGKFGYLVDGTGSLLRFTLDSGAIVKGMQGPTLQPKVTLQNVTIDALDTATGWSTDTFVTPPTNVLPDNGTYATWSDPDTAGGGWTPDNLDGSIDMEFVHPDTSSPGDKYIRMDDYGSAYTTTAPILNAQLAGTGTARYARHFRFGCRYFAKNAADGSEITIYTYRDTAGTDLIAQRTRVFTATGLNARLNWDGVISFADVDEPILSYRVQVRAGQNNKPGGDSPYFGRVTLVPYLPSWSITTTGGHVSFGITSPPDETTAYVAGQRLIKHYTTPTDFSGNNVLAIGYGAISTLTGLSFNLVFRNNSGVESINSNDVTFSTDGTFAYIDISTIPADERTNITDLELWFDGDANVTAFKGGLFSLGPLTGAGNLSIDEASYTWVETEVNDLGDTALLAVLESNPSTPSEPIDPDNQKAKAQIEGLTGFTNDDATHRRIYRFGGTFADGYARLIATVKDGVPVAYGSDTANPYYSWDGAGVLVDNTPDSALTFADTLTVGRDAPPVGAQCIAEWQGRLWLAKGSTLYCSWQVQADLENALYFTSVNLLNDPEQSIKGATFSLGANDNDPILALVPYGTNLVVFKSRSVWLVVGYDPSNFAAQSYLINAGVGLIAPRGAAIVGNHVWFLGASGLFQFNADIVDPKSVQIESVLNPHTTDGRAAISANAYKGVSMTFHDQRLYMFAPQQGEQRNSVCYVWDSRQSGYTRWLSMGMTCGASLSGGQDNNDFWAAGYDGQLYQFGGPADQITAESPYIPIAFKVRSRGMGQETDGAAFWTANQATRGYVQATTLAQQGLTLQWDAGTAETTYSKVYYFTGTQSPRISVPSRVRGNLLYAQVSGETYRQVCISALALDTAQGGYEA